MRYDLLNLDSSVIKSLVNSGVELSYGYLFFQATKNSDLDMIQFLLRHTAMPTAPNNNGNTLLHYACKQQNSEAIVRLLLNYPFDINAKDSIGNTPLHLVCCKETAHLLLDAGADPNIVNINGLTAKNVCFLESRNVLNKYSYKYDAIVELLETYNIPDAKDALDE